jgi:ferritin-like metal-binding protein YciE
VNFFADKLNSMEDLFFHEIEDLYDAEQRLVEALPAMAEAATCPKLKEAINKHRGQTEQHVQRLVNIFHQFGKEPEGTTCRGMRGLIAEGDGIVSLEGDRDVKDAALIGAAQRVEHYEIAAYGTARTFAQRLGYQQAVTLLQTTLDEETATDKELTAIAEESVNLAAQHAG